jgi:hypothetical protein
MSKTVAFKMPASKTDQADAWIEQGVEPHLKEVESPATASVLTKRFTLDVPVELHARVKIGCAKRGKTMVEVICRWMDAEFPA